MRLSVGQKATFCRQVRLQALRGEAEVRAPDDKELLEQLAEVEADLKAGGLEDQRPPC